MLSNPSSRDEYAAYQAEWARRESLWSLARLGIFVLAILAWVFLWRQPLLAGGVTAGLLAAFALAVRRHQDAQQCREHGDRLLLIAAESRRRRGGTVDLIRDCERPPSDEAIDTALPRHDDEGQVWELSDQERDDLDLFARPVGIFGLLNRTSTNIGARRLAELLDRPLLDVDAILRRQAAVRWLTTNEPQRDRLMAAAAALRLENARLALLVQAIHGCEPLAVVPPPRLLRGWSVVSVLLTLWCTGMVLSGQWGWAAGFGALFTANLALNVGMLKQLRRALEPWLDVGWALRGMRFVAAAADELPTDGLLGQLREPLARLSNAGSLAAIQRRTGWAERGGMMQFLFNVLAFYDVHVAESITRRVHSQKDTLLAAIESMARLEAFCSLACFAAEQPCVCFPQFVAAREVCLRGGVHPLVAPQLVVPNDLEFSAAGRMRIITGSNMAGKSTYLRMVGVNVLLAHAGAAATAREMSLPPLRLISDLRARDNLAQGESYFLSEVRHLRRMITPPAGQTTILGLIDEPFRGTNSQDQSAASVAVVKHLAASQHFFLLATHDRNLTTLATDAARNFHFQENLGADGLVFDYKLHDGPATTRNALRILEREGYPASVLRDAHDWLAAGG
jgi:MutS domain V/MutS domain III